jgi:hypothetical protein
MSRLIPKAEPKPVAIALTIVAEPGERTTFFIKHQKLLKKLLIM